MGGFLRAAEADEVRELLGGVVEERLARRTETFRGIELADADKPEILRRYLKKWAWEVGAFFGDDVTADSSDERLLEVAPGFPVFRVEHA